MREIRVAFIYKKLNIFFKNLKHFDTTYYYFFMDALNELNNDKAVDSRVDLMITLIK